MSTVCEPAAPDLARSETVVLAEPVGAAKARLIVILGLLVAIGPLTIDMYLPSLPMIVSDLHTSAAAVQLTLTGTLAGLALGQLLIGPLSDVVGRRLPVIVGIAVHIGASVLCIVAPNIAVLGALRVFQGVGTAAASVVATAVVRDVFAGSTAAKVFSRLLLVMGVAPILAPTLGSQVLRWTDWRGVFVTLAILGTALLLLAAVALPETLPRERRRRGGLAVTLADYRALLRDRSYVGLVIVTGFTMASLFAYVAGSSFVYQEQYGLSVAQFGIVFGAGAASLIAASQLNVRLLNRYTPQAILVAALVIGAVAGVALLLVAATGRGGIVSVMILLWVVLGAAGLTFPNAPALALNRHGDAAGTAAALLGAVQFGVGAAAAPIVGALGTGATSMAIVVAGGMVIALIVLYAVARPSTLAITEPTLAPALR